MLKFVDKSWLFVAVELVAGSSEEERVGGNPMVSVCGRVWEGCWHQVAAGCEWKGSAGDMDVSGCGFGAVYGAGKGDGDAGRYWA